MNASKPPDWPGAPDWIERIALRVMAGMIFGFVVWVLLWIWG